MAKDREQDHEGENIETKYQERVRKEPADAWKSKPSLSDFLFLFFFFAFFFFILLDALCCALLGATRATKAPKALGGE